MRLLTTAPLGAYGNYMATGNYMTTTSDMLHHRAPPPPLCPLAAQFGVSYSELWKLHTASRSSTSLQARLQAHDQLLQLVQVWNRNCSMMQYCGNTAATSSWKSAAMSTVVVRVREVVTLLLASSPCC